MVNLVKNHGEIVTADVISDRHGIFHMEKFKTYQEAYFDFLINRNRASYNEFIKLLRVARPELVTYNEIFCKVEADLIDAISDIFRKRQAKQKGIQNESIEQKQAYSS